MAPKPKATKAAQKGSVSLDSDLKGYFIPGLPTGYPWLDYVSGVPGLLFPYGTIVELMGLQSTSKTTLLIEAIGSAQALGLDKKIAYFDFEGTIQKQIPYAMTIGADLTEGSKVDYYRPDTMQEGGDLITKLVRDKQHEYAMIVIDTVAAMRPAQEIANGFGQTNQQGIRGKLMSELMRNVSADLKPDGPCIVLINQVMEKVAIGGGPVRPGYLPKEYDSVASNSLKFYASIRYQLTLKETVTSVDVNPHSFEESKTKVGSIIEIEGIKNKVGVPFLKAKFLVRYGVGIDPLPTLLKAGLLCPQAVFKGEGSGGGVLSYKLPDGTYSARINGMANFLDFLRENPDIVRECAAQISEEWALCVDLKMHKITAKSGALFNEPADEETAAAAAGEAMQEGSGVL